MAGIYIHIPFCSQYCTYCNFYSVKQLGLRERFIEAFAKETEYRKDFFKETGSSITTLYIGGGTPSVLHPEQLEKIVRSVVGVFGVSLPGVCNTGSNVFENCIEEFTVEVNPDDITAEYASFLVHLGVNRVSMGMQSFVDSHLKWMNRRHDAEAGVRAYRILREAGLENISLDLIFGYSLLSGEDWEYNISEILELAPEHISAYQMSVEPGSALGTMTRKGLYKPLSDEECEKQYLLLQKRLSDAGYMQYEISNFAKPGKVSSGLATQVESLQELCRKSVHNSSYWDGTPYLGLGPAAHSFTGRQASGGVRRSWNNPSVKKYCEYYSGANCIVGGYEELSAADIFNETVMLGLRRIEGFSLNTLDSGYLHRIMPQIASLVRDGLLIKEENNIRIPAHKLFISDSIIRELFV